MLSQLFATLTHLPSLPSPNLRSAYKTLTTIESRASDLVDEVNGGEAQNGVSLSVSPTSLALVKLGEGECGTGLSRVGAAATQLSQCPAGTELEANKQKDADTPVVFVDQVRWCAGGVLELLCQSACMPCIVTAPYNLLFAASVSYPTPATHLVCSPSRHTAPALPLPQACGPCEPGKKCGGSGAARFADLCPPGSYSNLWGALDCSTCQDLTAAITSGSVKCQECAAGTTPSADKKTCVLCPVGTYNTVPGDACQACPAGTYREADGGDGTECTKCAPGSWSALGAGECTLCLAGYAAPDEGSTSCAAW